MEQKSQPLKVCILAAGKGERMHTVSPHLHKALLPVENKPVILHIIEQLPKNCEIFIAVGHKADQLKDFFSVVPLKHSIQFIDIPHFSGDGAGPGTTLLQCRKQLDSPFLVVCADTLWNEELNLNPQHSTVFVHTPRDKDLRRFCNISFDKDNVVRGIFDKELPPSNETFESFTGLVYIHNPETFFKNLETSNLIAGERQICSGLVEFVQKGECQVLPLPTWQDVGTPDNYNAIENKPRLSFKKTNEDLFFIDNLVVKFFENENVCQERIERFHIDRDIHPLLLHAGKHFYSFFHSEGKTLKAVLSETLFSDFLKYCSTHLWKTREEPQNFQQLTDDFYRARTLLRLDQIRKDHPDAQELHALQSYVDCYNWSALFTHARCVRFHGDLQLDNVIYNGKKFQLIDFRQSYSGDVQCGDLQYDFAKLLTSICVDFESLVTEGEIRPIANHNSYIAKLQKQAVAESLDFAVIESMVPLILMNMMALHHKGVALRLAKAILQRIQTSSSQVVHEASVSI